MWLKIIQNGKRESPCAIYNRSYLFWRECWNAFIGFQWFQGLHFKCYGTHDLSQAYVTQIDSDEQAIYPAKLNVSQSILRHNFWYCNLTFHLSQISEYTLTYTRTIYLVKLHKHMCLIFNGMTICVLLSQRALNWRHFACHYIILLSKSRDSTTFDCVHERHTHTHTQSFEWSTVT